MDKYLSTYTNKIDAKGRVSVPAPFRTNLAKEDFAGVFCYPALDRPAIDAGGALLMAHIDDLLEQVGPFAEDFEDLQGAVFGSSINLKIDQDGRIILPDEMKDHAGIKDQVTFVGLGQSFQIWEPEAYQRQAAQSRQKLRDFKSRQNAVAQKAGASVSTRE